MSRFPATRIAVSQPSFAASLHGLGSFRLYPFSSILNTALVSGGSTVTLITPSLELYTGLTTAVGDNRGREACEKVPYPLFLGYDGLDYWSRPHHLTVFLTIGVGNVINAGSYLYSVLYMHPPGVPPWTTTPVNNPYCMLRYVRNGVLDPSGEDERYELITARGDGTAQLVTRLVGVDPPRSPVSPGGQRTERLEIIYKPGEYVAALINGVEGARHISTDPLPIPTTTPPLNDTLSGIGVYLENASQLNQSFKSAFHDLILETPRP